MNTFADRMRAIRRALGANGDRTKGASFARELGVNRYTLAGWETKNLEEPECGLRGLADLFSHLAEVQRRQISPTALAAWAITGEGNFLQITHQPAAEDPPRLPELGADVSIEAVRAANEAAIHRGLYEHVLEPAEAQVLQRALKKIGLVAAPVLIALGLGGTADATVRPRDLKSPGPERDRAGSTPASPIILDDERKRARRKGWSPRRLRARSAPLALVIRLDDVRAASIPSPHALRERMGA